MTDDGGYPVTQFCQISVSLSMRYLFILEVVQSSKTGFCLVSPLFGTTAPSETLIQAVKFDFVDPLGDCQDWSWQPANSGPIKVGHAIFMSIDLGLSDNREYIKMVMYMRKMM